MSNSPLVQSSSIIEGNRKSNTLWNGQVPRPYLSLKNRNKFNSCELVKAQTPQGPQHFSKIEFADNTLSDGTPSLSKIGKNMKYLDDSSREGPELHRRLRELNINKPTQSVKSVDSSSFIDSNEQHENALHQDLQYVSSLDTIEMLDISQDSTSSQLITAQEEVEKQKERVKKCCKKSEKLAVTSMESQVKQIFKGLRCSSRETASVTQLQPTDDSKVAQKVLVIDSQASFCETIDSFFMVLNFRNRMENVRYVHSGIQALKMMQREIQVNPYTYALIMIECDLPEISGYQLARHIRRLYKLIGIPLKHQPIIVGLSACKPDKKIIDDAVKCGMDKVLSKLISLRRLGKLLVSLDLIQEMPPQLIEGCHRLQQ